MTPTTTRARQVRAAAAPTSSRSGSGRSRPDVEHRLGSGLRLDVAYWQRHVDEYADPNVFFGTTIVFPNAVAYGRATVSTRVSRSRRGGPWSGYANVSVGKVTQMGPITGGLFLDDDVADIGPGVEFTPDHDQRVGVSAGLTWTGRRGVSLSAVVPPRERHAARATMTRGRRARGAAGCRAGRSRARTGPAADAGLAARHAAASRRRRARGRACARAVLNLFGPRYAYNFGNPFSGTHFGAPRTASVTLHVETREGGHRTTERAAVRLGLPMTHS